MLGYEMSLIKRSPLRKGFLTSSKASEIGDYGEVYVYSSADQSAPYILLCIARTVPHFVVCGTVRIETAAPMPVCDGCCQSSNKLKY